MTSLQSAVSQIQAAQKKSKKPLAIILAGHNGSGKSTMWTKKLSSHFQFPLVNADRMMMSILPEIAGDDVLPPWAASLRDSNTDWMEVAQKGVESFVAQAMIKQVPFAMETVFSHWKDLGKGKVESKIDLILQMQKAGYFVLLLFVGLSNSQLSLARVATRKASGGHAVDEAKLLSRFPRTQNAIRAAAGIADAIIMTDNSRKADQAFTVCRIQMGETEIYDRRNAKSHMPAAILEWLDVICPKAG